MTPLSKNLCLKIGKFTDDERRAWIKPEREVNSPRPAYAWNPSIRPAVRKALNELKKSNQDLSERHQCLYAKMLIEAVATNTDDHVFTVWRRSSARLIEYIAHLSCKLQNVLFLPQHR